MKNIFLLVAIFATTISFSQNKLSGKITDYNANPLSNVVLQIEENNAFTETNENGLYQFTNIPKGNVTLTINLLGYETKITTINTTKTTELNFQLQEEVHHLTELILITPFSKTQAENVQKVEHQSVVEMQQNGATSLIDGITQMTGVNQISTGTSIGKPVIRSLSGSRIVTFSQGIRLENQQFGDEHGLGLSASGVESVELIKGPASLLYGSDAIGGILYFNPEKYAQENTSKTSIFQQFSSNTQGTNTSVGYKISPNNWKILVRGNYNSQADYKIPNGERIVNTRAIEKDLKYGIGYANSTFSTDFRYNYNNLNLGLPEEEIENSDFRNPIYPKQEIDNHILSLNQKVYFKNSKLDADFGYQFNNRKELEAVDEIALQMKLKTANFNLKYYLPKWKNIETIIGSQGMYQTNENLGEEMLIPNAKVNDFGSFITSNYEVKKHVFQAGIRFDNRKISTEEHGVLSEEGYFEAIQKLFNSFNFAFGYKTDFFDKITLRLNLTSGFRAPNLAELTSNGVHEGSNRYEIGNSDLENEQSFQTDLHIEYDNEHFDFFVNGFYNHINDYIYLTPLGTTINENPAYQYVQNNAFLYGGETGIHLHPHPWDWLHITSSYEMVMGKQENGNYLPLIPANQWKNTLKANLNLTKKLTNTFVSLQVNHIFQQNNVSEFETNSTDYTLLNLGIGSTFKWKEKSFNFTINGTNLLNKNYIAHLSRLKADGIPNIGRNIVLGLNFEF